MLKRALCFFCQLAHFIPNDGKEATKALKKFGRVPKRKKNAQNGLEYNFFGVSFKYDIQ